MTSKLKKLEVISTAETITWSYIYTCVCGRTCFQETNLLSIICSSRI